MDVFKSRKRMWAFFFWLKKCMSILVAKIVPKNNSTIFFQSTIYFFFAGFISHVQSLNRVLTFYILFLSCLSFGGQWLEEGQRAQYSQRVLSSLKFFHHQRIYIELYGEKPSTLLLIFPVFYSKGLIQIIWNL